MAVSPFSYQLQKFREARTALMAPHRDGEHTDFCSALLACTLALNAFDRIQLNATVIDDNVRKWIAIVRETIIEGFPSSMSIDKKSAFSNAVDELANWFAADFWSKTGNETTAVNEPTA